MMTREEMIKKLENTAFCAVPVMMTMDMGVQYDFITAEGAGSLFGTLGEWPAYCMQVVEESKWRRIREKIADGTVEEVDFAGTDIEGILSHLHEVYEDSFLEYYDNLAEVFADLLELPEVLSGAFYCILDGTAWGEFPRFFAEKESFLEAFQEEYCYDIQPWEDWSDEELDMWLQRTEGDLAEFPFVGK